MFNFYVTGKYPGPFICNGDILLKEGRYDESLKEYQLALSLDPNSIDAWLKIAKVLIFQEKFILANEIYSEAISIIPNNTDLWLAKGENLENIGAFDQSLDCYDAALKINPKSVIIWDKKISFLIFIREIEKAKLAFSLAIETLPCDNDLLIRSLSNLTNLGIIEEIIDFCELSIKKNPKNFTAWKIKGKTLINLEKFDAALLTFIDGLKSIPGDVILLKYAASLSFLLDEKSLANKFYDELIDKISKGSHLSDDSKISIYLDFCMLNIQNGYIRKAILSMNNALNVDQNSAFCKIFNYYSIEDLIQIIEKFLKLHPTNEYAIALFSKFLSLTDNNDESLFYMNKIKNKDPILDWFWVGKCRYCLESGSYLDSILAYEMITHSSSCDYNIYIDAWDYFSYKLEKCGLFSEALTALNRCYDLKQNECVNYYLRKASLLKKMGKFAECQKALEKGQRLEVEQYQ